MIVLVLLDLKLETKDCFHTDIYDYTWAALNLSERPGVYKEQRGAFFLSNL